MTVRELPECEPRAETEATRFGDDWPGVFIRGDDCFHYALRLRQLLDGRPDAFTTTVLEGLCELLESSRARE